jgi:hypothetical protein
VQREIVFHDGSIMNYDAQPALLRDQLSGNRLQRSFPLSKRAISGPARYRALSCYACNPLQHWWPIWRALARNFVRDSVASAGEIRDLKMHCT